MTIYHFEDDAEYLRTNVLPKKTFFILDMYSTLLLSDPFDSNISFLRKKTIDFLTQYPQEKVIYTDARKRDIVDDLEKFQLLQYFSKIYHSKHLRRKEKQIPNRLIDKIISGIDIEEELIELNPKMMKRYEAIARIHHHNLESSIIFEDFEPNNSRLKYLKIDYVLIPNNAHMGLLIGDEKDPDKWVIEKQELNNYSFGKLLPKM